MADYTLENILAVSNVFSVTKHVMNAIGDETLHPMTDETIDELISSQVIAVLRERNGGEK